MSTLNQDNSSGGMDDRLAVLADDACRAALSRLRAGPDGALSVDELAADDYGACRAGSTDRATALHHTTLPKLDDAGLIRYDSKAKTVSYEANESLEAWLDAIESQKERGQ